MLHFIKQAPGNGGASSFVDTFSVCQKFKDTDPESFQLLADVPIAFYDIGVDTFGEYDMRFSHPTIR